MLTPATPPPARVRPALRAAALVVGAFLAVAASSAAQAQEVFINEIHYDNAGADVGEFVEVAGPAGTDLTGWAVALYNGSNGEVYEPVGLSGVIEDEGNGFGALSFVQEGIQNGAPDGLALVNAGGAVVQFLSYEGSFTAVGGPADGMESEDIGVQEGGSTPAGFSLQLSGAGTTYDDFAWTGPAADSPGAVNAGQTFADAPAGGVIVVTTANDENNSDAFCSLREAVIAANTNAAVSGCAPGTADGDRITFASGFTITLTLGDIQITDDVEIDGSAFASGVTVDGDDASRIFDVDAAGGAGSEQAVVFTSLTLQNGNSSTEPLDAGGAVDLKSGSEATFTDVMVTGSTAGLNGGGVHGAGNTVVRITTTVGGSSFIGNNTAGVEGGGVWTAGALTVSGGTTISNNQAFGDMADGGGGGLYNEGGTMTVEDGVTISSNRAAGTSGSGGGILNNGGTLTVGAATIESNTANRAGGGIEDAGGVVVLNGTNLVRNSIAVANPGNGGGLHTGGGDVTINGGQVSTNTATEGGGLWSSGTLDVTGTSITGNTGTGDAADNGGGGLYNEGGTMTVTDATVSGNRATGASGSGGGVLVAGGSFTASGGAISENTANRAGGGIEVASGTVTLSDVDFTANETGDAPGNGGALHVTNGTVTATDGTVSGNTAAAEGGGFWNNAGFTMTVTGTTFSGNTASGDMASNGGGGLYNNGGTLVLNDVTVDENTADGTSGSGGGVLTNGGTLTVDGGTISGNTANRAGGGIEDAGGVVTLTDVTVSGNFIDVAAPGNGGGLHSGGGSVTVNGGSFENNTATEGGGLWSNATLVVQSSDAGPALITGNEGTGPDAANGGGGVYAETGADVTIDGATIFGNSATGAAGSGGGILVVDGAAVTMTLGSVSGNSANRAGGGIEVADGGSLSLSQVTVDGNALPGASPGNGGGVHVGGAGSATVSQTTVSNNTAVEGGGLWNSGSGTLAISNSTVSGNSASDDGGGVYTIPGGDTSLESVTVARNTAGADGGGLAISALAMGSVSVDNSIVGDNTAGGSGNDCFGSYTTDGFLLVEDRGPDCSFAGANGNSIFGEDPELGPLADNGGPTMTHALMDDSPAIDAGQTALAVDQRGEPRDDGQDDLGAFERGDGGGGAVACTQDSRVSFDFDGDGSVMADDFSSTSGGSMGEFAGVRNESEAGPAVDLSTCSFVTFDPFSTPESIIYSAVTAGTVAPGDVYTLATNGGDQTLPADVFFDNSGAGGPGAFALVEGTAEAGAPITTVFGRVVAAVVYDRNGDVFGSVGGGATEAEMQAFRQALARAFSGQAVSTEGGDAVDLTVAAWPNPTRGAATVAFGLAEGGAARVAVYDALGREVVVAADGPFGPGRHEVAVRAGALPAGVYIVRVATEGGVQTARLTVAR